VTSPPKRASWKCPKCGRTFARARQAHSCQVVSLDAHLNKVTPETRAIFDEVMRAVRACGRVQVAPTKTGINLLSRTSLGSVSLHRGYVDLGLVLTREVKSPRILWTLRLSPRSVGHRVRVASPNEVDRELRGWIKEAYDVGMMAGRRPKQ
jgi:hypothetical protein